MTTAFTAGSRPSAGAVPDPGSRPPFGRLVRTEFRKLTDTRSGRWLLIAITAVTPLVVAVTLFTADPDTLTYDRFVDFTQSPQKILLPLLGLLTITTEWSQRTGLVTFTLVPGRGRVLRAKAAATFLLGIGVISVAFATAAVGNVLGMALRHGNGSWSFGAGGFRDIALVQLTGLAQGLAFGMLLLVSAAAIVAYYVLPNLSSLLFNAVSGLDGAKGWWDLNSAQNPLYQHDMDGRAWIRLCTAVLIWVVLPAAGGVVRVLRSEVRGG
jgi:ABC-2 type transport system permease protein